MPNRRDFLKTSAGAGAATLLAGSALGAIPRLLSASAAPAPSGKTLDAFQQPAQVKALMMAALNAAKMAGASYADVRCSRQRQNFVFTREQQIQNVVDTDTIGIGVRALVDGTWGFAATRLLTADAAAAAAREAVAIAKASKVARDRSRARCTPTSPGRARTRPTRGTFPSSRRPISCSRPTPPR
jgi:TldD protein